MTGPHPTLGPGDAATTVGWPSLSGHSTSRSRRAGVRWVRGSRTSGHTEGKVRGQRVGFRWRRIGMRAGGVGGHRQARSAGAGTQGGVAPDSEGPRRARSHTGPRCFSPETRPRLGTRWERAGLGCGHAPGERRDTGLSKPSRPPRGRGTAVPGHGQVLTEGSLGAGDALTLVLSPLAGPPAPCAQCLGRGQASR